MKNITFLATLLLTSVCSFAQNFYTFSTSQETYIDLEDPISINENQSWNNESFGPFPLPFTFSVFGDTFSYFFLFQDYFILINTIENTSNIATFQPISANLQDRNFNDDVSLSPISYKTEGIPGNRIHKMEIKNAGLKVEILEEENSNSFLNYQIWLYEGTNKIEYHFGPSLLNNILYVTNSNAIYSLVRTQTLTDTKMAILSGLVSNPTYNEITEQDLPPVNGLTSLPANGQIYTFKIGTLATKNESEISFKLFPIPTENELNVSLTEIADYNYAVYDIIGKKVISGEMKNTNEFSINTSSLTTGSYLIKINNTIKKFIKN